MIILLSGPAAVGKTTICQRLIEAHDFRLIKSSDHLRSIANQMGVEISRESLQSIGDDLDAETDYLWLVEQVAIPQMQKRPEHGRWIIDSVRKGRQVEHFRKKLSDGAKHIHIGAREDVVRERFEMRRADAGFGQYERTYSEHISHPNEISSRGLREVADFVLDYSEIGAGEACAQILKLVEIR